MQATFFKLSKRINSTKRPPAFGGLAREIRRTAPYNIYSPQFKLTDSDDISDYNYIKVTNPGTDNPVPYNYYYIYEWEQTPPFWTAYCRIDLLATYKDFIGSSTQYIMRSASKKDLTVADTYYKTYSQSVRSSYTVSDPSAVFPTQFLEGVWVIGLLNDGAAADAGASTTYYVFAEAQMREFLQALMSTTNILDNDDFSAGLMKNIVDPLQYVTYCQWLPIKFGTLQEQGCIKLKSGIHIGWWTSINLTAFEIVKAAYQWSVTLPIKIHPQAAERGNYLTHEPYTKYQCYFPGFGVFDLPADLMYPSGVFALQLTVDLITGKSMLRGYSHYSTTPGDYREVMILPGQMGIDYGLGQIAYGKQGDIKTSAVAAGAKALPDLGWNIINGLSNLFEGKDLPQELKDIYYNTGATKAVDTIGDGLSAADAMPATYGTTGSLIDYQHPITLYGSFNILLPSENDKIGSPLCNYYKISTLSGYVQCKNAQLPMDVPVKTQQSLEAIMDGGFYYE